MFLWIEKLLRRKNPYQTAARAAAGKLEKSFHNVKELSNEDQFCAHHLLADTEETKDYEGFSPDFTRVDKLVDEKRKELGRDNNPHTNVKYRFGDAGRHGGS